MMTKKKMIMKMRPLKAGRPSVGVRPPHTGIRANLLDSCRREIHVEERVKIT
jgi:hypothetical protein